MIAPAFGLVEIKGFVPHFLNAATKARRLHLDLVLKADFETLKLDGGQVE